MYTEQSMLSNRRGARGTQIAQAPASSALADVLALALQNLGQHEAVK